MKFFSRPYKLVALLVMALAISFIYWDSLSLKANSLSNGASYEPVKCWFVNNSKVKTECGYMTTRNDSESGVSFKLPVVILRNSHWKNSETPMLHISGGPGGSAYIDAETMPYWLKNFQTQNWGVDFVLYDQRGTGLGQPFLDCPDSHKTRLDSLQKPLSSSQDAAHFIKQMNKCHLQLSEESSFRNHMNAISTNHSTDDIADLHDLLKVNQWILMGVSYGTRLALNVVKQFPEKVHSMVLDSVYPPEFDGFETMIENGFKGIERLLDSCEKDMLCDGDFPDLSEQLRQALFQLVKSPLKLTVSREGSKLAKETILLSAHRLILLLDYASYDSRLLQEIPAAIIAVLDKDNSDKSLLKLASNYLDIELFVQFSEPVFMLTECKENGHFDMASLLERLQPYMEEYPMLDWSSEGIFNPLICKNWLTGVSDSSQRYRQSVTTDKPTLILNGGLDSITPAEWGRYLSKRLPNSRYFEYPNVGHSVLTSSLCANDEVQVFLNPQTSKTSFCNTKQRSLELSGEAINWAAVNN